MLAQALRPGCTDQLDEFLVGGVADACDGAEMPEQRLDGAGADTGDAFEFASEKVVAAFLAVEGDAEAVLLVADMAHHFERFARAAEVVGHRIARVVDLFEPFGQSHDRNLFFESQFAQDGIGVRELSLAAVDDHQVGQLLSLGHEARVAAEDDLAHRGEVVGSDDGLDVEMAVLLARGAAVAEDHARGDGVRSLQVRVVETFDVARLPRQPQLLLHGVHQPFGMAFGILDLHVFELLGAVDAGAALGESQQVEFFAPPGYGEGHPVEEHRCRRQEGDDHFARQFAAGDLLDDVLNGQRQHLRAVGIDARREPHGRDGRDRTVADAQEVAVGGIVVLDEREDVDVDDAGADDDRTGRIVLQCSEPRFVTLRRLELQRLGRAAHLPFEVGAHGAQVAFEHRDGHVEQLPVLLGALRADARPLAVAQVVLQADGVPAARDRFGSEIERAGAQRDHLADEFQDAVLHRHRRVGPEVLRAVALQLARGLDAGEVLAAHDDPRVGLVVFEQDVVAGLQLLDERIFEQQGVGFAVDDDVADLGDLAHQHPHLGGMLLVLHKIGGDALAQTLGLADVDDRTRPVEELVHPRFERQQRYLLFERIAVGGSHRGGYLASSHQR